jgi:hypothetical protein
VLESLRRLSAHTYLVVISDGRSERSATKGSALGKHVAEHAFRVASAWPDNAELLADRILAVLAEGVSNETDLEKRSKLKAGLKGVGRMTRDVLVDVVAAAIARSTGNAWP